MLRKRWGLAQPTVSGAVRICALLRAKPVRPSPEFTRVIVQRFAGGPLLLPGSPLMPLESCCCTVDSPAEPTVPWPGGGPLLPPGAPLTPAPEFCALVAVAAPPTPGWPGGCAAAPGASWLPTFPEAPELCVFTPLSASFCKFWLGAACWAMAGPAARAEATSTTDNILMRYLHCYPLLHNTRVARHFQPTAK
jgi:hypothetical protein